MNEQLYRAFERFADTMGMPWQEVLARLLERGNPTSQEQIDKWIIDHCDTARFTIIDSMKHPDVVQWYEDIGLAILKPWERYTRITVKPDEPVSNWLFWSDTNQEYDAISYEGFSKWRAAYEAKHGSFKRGNDCGAPVVINEPSTIPDQTVDARYEICITTPSGAELFIPKGGTMTVVSVGIHPERKKSEVLVSTKLGLRGYMPVEVFNMATYPTFTPFDPDSIF